MEPSAKTYAGLPNMQIPAQGPKREQAPADASPPSPALPFMAARPCHPDRQCAMGISSDLHSTTLLRAPW